MERGCGSEIRAMCRKKDVQEIQAGRLPQDFGKKSRINYTEMAAFIC